MNHETNVSIAAILTHVVIGLFSGTANAQDIPSREILEAIFPKKQPSAHPLTIVLESTPGSKIEPACGLQHVKLSETRGSKTRTFNILIDSQDNPSTNNASQVFVRLSRLTVDADGAGRAYHPNDPNGTGICKEVRKGEKTTLRGICALDSLSSASIRIFRGTEKIEPRLRTGASDTDFGAIWSNFWSLIHPGKIRPVDLRALLGSDAPDSAKLFYLKESNTAIVFNKNIIPFDGDYPCIRPRDSEYAGYFVAATAFNNPKATHLNGRAPAACDSLQYLDAAEISFFVMPGQTFGKIKVGDIAIGYASTGSDDRLVFGVVGDTGPFDQIGEGSIAFNRALLKNKRTPMNSADLSTIDIDLNRPLKDQEKIASLSVLVLGDTARLLGSNYSRTNIENIGRKELTRWNGTRGLTERLRNCTSDAPVNPHQVN